MAQAASVEGSTLIPVGFYINDINGPSIQQSGDEISGPYVSGKRRGGNTTNTDIRHISYQLAWWIYDNYTVNGETVDLVGHSMGGLIIRYMIYGLSFEPKWPPALLIEDAVTVATPHLGIDPKSRTSFLCLNGIQCSQFKAGSTFLKELSLKGRGPRATEGTDWTAIGAAKGDVASAHALTDMGADHVVIVPQSAHGDYFKVQSSIRLILDAVNRSDR